jgi:hypothetical protein
MVGEFFLDGVPVEPGDGAQAAGDGGPGPAAGFHIPGEALEVGPPDLEQPQVTLLAPGRVLAQVQRVSLTGQAGIASQEPGQCQSFLVGERWLGDGDRGGRRRCGGGHRAPPGSG